MESIKTLTLAVAIVFLVVTTGCSPVKAPKDTAPVPVLAAKAALTNIPVQIEPPPVGHVMPVQTVNVRPQIGGLISAVSFQEGQEVKQGDPLLTIDPRPMQAALEQAKANLQRDTAQLENAKIQFDRDQKLFTQSLISQDVFDTSKATVDGMNGTVAADQATVTNAQLNLQYTDIRAPISGRTGSLLFHAGNVVKSPDDVLLTINQIHPIYVTFGVPEKFLPEINRQMRDHPIKVAASFDHMDSAPQGELTFIDNSVDPTTGLIQLKATFPNEDGALWPGQFVTLSLTLSEMTNAVVVPAQAVQTGQNGSFVYVVKPDQTVEERPVTNSITYHGETVVENGMQAGETVVTDGQLRLVPGVKVDIKSK